MRQLSLSQKIKDATKETREDLMAHQKQQRQEMKTQYTNYVKLNDVKSMIDDITTPIGTELTI